MLLMKRISINLIHDFKSISWTTSRVVWKYSLSSITISFYRVHYGLRTNQTSSDSQRNKVSCSSPLVVIILKDLANSLKSCRARTSTRSQREVMFNWDANIYYSIYEQNIFKIAWKKAGNNKKKHKINHPNLLRSQRSHNVHERKLVAVSLQRNPCTHAISHETKY